MPAQKSEKLVKPAAKPVAKKLIKPRVPPKAKLKVVSTKARPQAKEPAKPATKVKPVPVTKSHAKSPDKPSAKDEVKKLAKAVAAAEEVARKKPGRPPKSQSADTAPPGVREIRLLAAAAGDPFSFAGKMGSEACSGCGRRFSQRDLTELTEDNHDNLTYFHGDRLCPACADNASVEH
jgi:hypothetical protein